MNDKQENKYSMFLATKKVLDGYGDAIKSMPALSRAVEQFNTKLIELEAVSAEREKDITGVTADKKKSAAALIEATLIVISKAQAYAKSLNNNELFKAMRYTRSDLEGSRDTALKDIGLMVYEKLKPIVKSMSDFNLTDEHLEDLKTKIGEYSDSLSKPREAIGKRKFAGETIDNLIADIDELLKGQVDLLVKTYTGSKEDMVSTYENARKLVTLGARSEPEEEPAEEKKA